MRSRTFMILSLAIALSSEAIAQDQGQGANEEPAVAVTGMGLVLSGAPAKGGWTNPNSTGLSSSSCQPGEYAIGVEVDGADSAVKYCIGCVARLRVICQRMP
jgi:hypothetical protein